MKKARSLRAALSLLLVCVLLGAILPAPRAHAADIEFSGVCGRDGDNLTWTLDDDGLLTVSGVGDMADYSWENPAPWPREDVCELVLEDGVASVGDRAFYDCVCLKSVRLPDSLASIGAFAFSGCDLSAVSLPAGLTALGDCAFAECELKSVKLPASLAAVGDNPFAGCAKLEKVRVAEGNPALYTKDGVLFSKEDGRLVCCPVGALRETLTVPDGTLAIGALAFQDCEELRALTLPDGLTAIGAEAFSGCDRLKTVVIPDSVTELGNSAFSCCSRLTKAVLPAGLTEIPLGLFDGCDSLADVAIPDSVTAIGGFAFSCCYDLSSLTIPAGVTEIGGWAFDDCEDLLLIVTRGSYAEQYCAEEDLRYTAVP